MKKIPIKYFHLVRKIKKCSFDYFKYFIIAKCSIIRLFWIYFALLLTNRNKILKYQPYNMKFNVIRT